MISYDGLYDQLQKKGIRKTDLTTEIWMGRMLLSGCWICWRYRIHNKITKREEHRLATGAFF